MCVVPTKTIRFAYTPISICIAKLLISSLYLRFMLSGRRIGWRSWSSGLFPSCPTRRTGLSQNPIRSIWGHLSRGWWCRGLPRGLAVACHRRGSGAERLLGRIFGGWSPGIMAEMGKMATPPNGTVRNYIHIQVSRSYWSERRIVISNFTTYECLKRREDCNRTVPVEGTKGKSFRKSDINVRH